MRRPFTTRGQRGIALFEALISILIFSFGVLGLIGLEARAIGFSVDAEDRNRAALFASEIASSMWMAGTVTVSAATLATWQTSVADPTKTGLPGGSVSVNPVGATTNSVDIVITWQPPTGAAAGTNSTLNTRVTLP